MLVSSMRFNNSRNCDLQCGDAVLDYGPDDLVVDMLIGVRQTVSQPARSRSKVSLDGLDIPLSVYVTLRLLLVRYSEALRRKSVGVKRTFHDRIQRYTSKSDRKT